MVPLGYVYTRLCCTGTQLLIRGGTAMRRRQIKQRASRGARGGHTSLGGGLSHLVLLSPLSRCSKISSDTGTSMG